jgi:hypothetical protein
MFMNVDKYFLYFLTCQPHPVAVRISEHLQYKTLKDTRCKHQLSELISVASVVLKVHHSELTLHFPLRVGVCTALVQYRLLTPSKTLRCARNQL